jgi:hypothetical protein
MICIVKKDFVRQGCVILKGTDIYIWNVLQKVMLVYYATPLELRWELGRTIQQPPPRDTIVLKQAREDGIALIRNCNILLHLLHFQTLKKLFKSRADLI